MDNQEKKQQLIKLGKFIEESLSKTFPSDMQINGGITALVERLAKTGGFNPDMKTKTLGIKFLEEAKRDSNSCHLLYKRRLYPHAIYHLQQGVEKAAKAYVLIEGFYKENEVREIQIHDSPLVLMKALIDQTGLKAQAKRNGDKETLSKILAAERAISNDQNRADLAKMSGTEVLSLLAQIENYDRMTIAVTKELSSLMQNQNFQALSKFDVQSICLPQNLLMLAIITFPHWSYTRYPGGKINPADYTLKFGIVRECPIILLRLKKEINTLEKIYKNG